MLIPVKLNLPHPLTPQQLRSVNSTAAQAVASLIRSHLFSLPGKSFYKQAAQSISISSQGNSHSVSISKPGIALQFYGGTVRPSGRISPVTGRPTRALLIPLVPQSEIHNLSSKPFTITSRSGARLLVSKKSSSLSLTPLAILSKSATIKPHPNILPSQSQINSTASSAAAHFIAHIITSHA